MRLATLLILSPGPLGKAGYSVKEFTTAVELAEKPEDAPLEFKVDGVLCRAYRPSDGQIAFLMASTGRHSTEEEQIAGIVNFFVAVMDDDSHTYLVSKLLDRRDPFGISDVQAIMEWMIQEWSGRPTKSPSGSTTSRQTDGQKSTEPAPALT